MNLKRRPVLSFLFRLALEVGRVDVSAMAEEMTADDVAWWMAFERCEPFGDAWRRTARQALVIANSNGAKLKGKFESEFMPLYDPTAAEHTSDEAAAILKRYTNGKKRKQ